MKEKNEEKEITTKELIVYLSDQFEKVFTILDSKAGKDDLENLRTELKSDIAELRSELKFDIAELRSELIDTKDELKGDIHNLRKDTNQRFFALKSV